MARRWQEWNLVQTTMVIFRMIQISTGCGSQVCCWSFFFTALGIFLVVDKILTRALLQIKSDLVCKILINTGQNWVRTKFWFFYGNNKKHWFSQVTVAYRDIWSLMDFPASNFIYWFRLWSENNLQMLWKSSFVMWLYQKLLERLHKFKVV